MISVCVCVYGYGNCWVCVFVFVWIYFLHASHLVSPCLRVNDAQSQWTIHHHWRSVFWGSRVCVCVCACETYLGQTPCKVPQSVQVSNFFFFQDSDTPERPEIFYTVKMKPGDKVMRPLNGRWVTVSFPPTPGNRWDRRLLLSLASLWGDWRLWWWKVRIS